MNFQEYLNGIDDFDKISRRIWADMKGEKPITNSINPYYTNLWVDEEKLFKLLRSSTDFNTYVFDAQKDFISSSQEVEKVSFKEIPPPKIDNTRVKTKMTEKLIIQKPKIEDLKFQDTLFDRVDGKVWVNISQGYIDPQKYTHHTHLNIRKREIQCIINIPYREYSRRTSTAINEVEMTVDNSSDTPDAIQIKLSDAEDYMDVITYLFPYHKEMAQVALVNHFEEAGRGLTSIDDLMFFYNHLPTFALNGVDYKGKTKKLSDELLWEHFLKFLKYDSQLLKDVNTVGKAAALVVEPFRDKSCYAIRILMAISGEFVYTKLKNNSTLIFQIYHSLDGESVYLGNGVISEINQVKYGDGVNNRDLFVTYVTAFMQAKHAMDDEHQPQKKGCVFLFGTKKISDIIEKYYELNGNFMEGDPDNNFADVDKITLINTAKDWNVKTHEFDDEVEIEHDAFRPLDMLHLKVYEKVQDQYLETDTEVPALFLYHIAQQRALKDALRCLRITADLVVIGVSALTIASGVSGMPLYVAVADLGFALSDTYIESQLRDELEMTSKGRELLDVWDNVFMVQGTTSIMAGMLPKAGGALVKSTEVMYTSRTYSSQQKNLQTLIKNTLYSFPLRGFSKKGLNVLLKDGIKNITRHSTAFEKLNVLFVENAEKEVAVLYKGKKFFQANSSGRTGKFLDYLYSKAGGNTAKLEEEMSRLVGMAENIDTGIKMSVEEFEAGWKALQEAMDKGIITAENAMDYLDEALIYFNHHIVNGKIVQISNRNCINVVQAVEDFLRTGKINPATVSEAQKLRAITNKYGGTFLTLKIETLQNKNYFKVGERGILYCDRGPNDYDHVINVFMTEEGLILKDFQTESQEFITIKYLKNIYLSDFKLLKTKKN
ncbi:hypothetical protein [uncultured Chryseobacterium sp.]|uniref:hypothetical protein n=1 Tax=uncultured Chryseobacterium sp. TaxID=259322 RepID=UPI00258AD0C4|nr:hypothetical protein [uncultured Chryseobacterium sp.]